MAKVYRKHSSNVFSYVSYVNVNIIYLIISSIDYHKRDEILNAIMNNIADINDKLAETTLNKIKIG